jgi:hypothetical protein
MEAGPMEMNSMGDDHEEFVMSLAPTADVV